MLAPSSQHHQAPRRLPDRSMETTSLLYPCNVVLDDLSRIVKAWKHFEKCDIEYFQVDDEDTNVADTINYSLLSIQRKYTRLEVNMDVLQKLCRDLGVYRDMSIRMSQANLAAENVGITQQLQIMDREKSRLAHKQQGWGEILGGLLNGLLLSIGMLLGLKAT